MNFKSDITENLRFQDFDVGTVYKKKIVLTNVSYVTNHCKLLGVSAKLKHILSVR